MNDPHNLRCGLEGHPHLLYGTGNLLIFRESYSGIQIKPNVFFALHCMTAEARRGDGDDVEGKG